MLTYVNAVIFLDSTLRSTATHAHDNCNNPNGQAGSALWQTLPDDVEAVACFEPKG
jgi:hypothetical protein